jgi:hypothetical protein
LVRTGKVKTAFDAYNQWIDDNNPTWSAGEIVNDFTKINFTVNKNEVFPIPLVELELANAIERWGQNQGY